MKKTLLALLGVAILIYIFIFMHVPADKFLFIHDEYLVFSKQESIESFFVRNSNDFGYSNFATIIVTFWDRVLYLALYLVGLQLPLISKISYFIKFIIAVVLPYIGFRKLMGKHGEVSEVSLFLITLVYAFGSYPLVYWHGNGFSLSLLIFYSLAPLAFTKIQDLTEHAFDLKELIGFVIVLFFMCFGFYMFLVFALMSLIYILLSRRWSIVIKNILKSFLLFVPFISLFWLIVYDMFFSSVQNVNFSGGETYNQVQGGFLYPLFLWFSWAIYNIWTPRSLFTFYEYLQSPFYILPVVSMYVAIIYLIIKYKLNNKLLNLILIFIVMLFFVKGAQPPLGSLYVYLIEKVPVFRVFRSPDNKFGFGVFTTLLFIVTYVVARFSSFTKNDKHRFLMFLTIFVVAQLAVFVSGIGLIGQNSSDSSDRVLAVPQAYTELQAKLHEEEYGFLLSEPQSDFSYFDLGGEDKHFGQDIVAKIIDKPVVYTNEHSSISKDAYKKLQNAVRTGNVSTLDEFPIKYYLVRRDDLLTKPNLSVVSFFDANFEKIFENSYFTLYKNPNAINIIESDSDILVEKVSPVEYKIRFSSPEKSSDVILFENFSSGWNIEGAGKTAPSQRLSGDYGNIWHLKDIPSDMEYRIYYNPQLLFRYGLIVSAIYLFALTAMYTLLTKKQPIKA